MTQGIGARVQRKEDARHLHGRGSFVSDMILPGQSEVAFLRSPIAHGRIRRIVKPPGTESDVFVRADLHDVAAIVAPTTVPGYKLSECHPLAHDKVRFVGEAIAMCVAPTRAEAEDLTEQVEVEFDELPVLVDAHAARMEPTTRVHEDWSDNVFLTLNYESGFDAKAKGAPVVIRREIALSRQAMVPMEGKAVLAHWDDRGNQLVVYASTQVPHIIRVGLARFLGIDQGRVRVISPDVGGGFGYKAVLQPEELCVAWLALKYRRPFRYIEDRREHLVVGANSRQHHYRITAHADARGQILALDAEVMIDGGAYSAWPFTVALEPGQATGNLPGPYDLRGYRCRTHCVATNKPGFLPYRGVARTGVCFAMELTIDAVARAVGREPWEVRHDNLVPASAMPYDNVTRKHYDSGDYRKALTLAREKIDLTAWRERQKRGEPDGRLIGVGFGSYCEQSAHGTSVFSAWGLPIVPGYDQATVQVTADGGLELRAGVHSHGQGMETTLAQIAHEMLGIDLAEIRVVLGDTGTTPYSTGTYASRSIVMAGGAVANACKALIPRFVAIGAHIMQCAVNDGALRERPDRRAATVGASARRGRGLVPPAGAAAARRRPGRARSHGGIPSHGRQRRVQLRFACRRGCGRYADRQCRDPRLRHRRGLRHAGEPDGGRRPDARRRRARHRHRALRGEPVRSERPAAGLDLCRLPAAGADRDPRHPHLSHGDAVALHRVRHQGHGRRRRDRAAGGDLQRGQ